MNREALARAAVISTLTAGALVALAVRPELAEPIGGALLVLVPAVLDSWAFVVRHRGAPR